MVQKFQLIQTAHEVLSDPAKRATYDRTRITNIRISTTYTKPPAPPSTSPYKRRTNTGTNGFTKTTPHTSKPASQDYFGNVPPRPPPSAKKTPSGTTKPPPTGFTGQAKTARSKASEKDKANAYFDEFRTKTASWQSPSPQKATPHTKAQQKKEEAQKAAGIKTPKKPAPNRFGTSFEDEESSDEDTFYSFSSKAGTFNGSPMKQGTNWSERRTAYSHVFTGVKEDLRSPLKNNASKSNMNDIPGPANGFHTKSTGFPSDGFKPQTNGTSAPAKEAEKKSEAPSQFAPGPARWKSSQQSASNSTAQSDTPSTNPNEIPKTPPPVEERLFASAFSRLNVNREVPNPTPKVKPAVDIEDWTKKFEGMNPFMTPAPKEPEKKTFVSPLKSAQPRARQGLRSKVRNEELGDMTGLKRELPKKDNTTPGFEGFGVSPIFANFKMNVPQFVKPEESIFNMANGVPPADPPFPTSPTRPPQPPPAFQSPPPNSIPSPPQPQTAAPPQPMFSSSNIPKFNPPAPPKRLVPNPLKPHDFAFSVPPKADMESLAAEVQAYHFAFVSERSRFEAAWNNYESEIQFEFTNEFQVRQYLLMKAELVKQRDEMEALHTLCVERWGTVAKFAKFTG